MPRYKYRCSDCRGFFEKIHPYKQKISLCDLCGKDGFVTKYFGDPIMLRRKIKVKHQIGEVVKQTIEQTKQEISKDKLKLKSRKK